MAEIVPVPACEPAIRLPKKFPSPASPSVPGREPGPPDGCKGEAAGIPPSWNKTVDVHCDKPEALSIRQQSIADAVLAEVAAPPITVTHKGSTGDNPHRFHVILLIEGHGVHRWVDGAATQRPGDIVLLDTAEASQVTAAVDNRVLRWSFPETLIAPFLPVSDDLPVRHLPASDGLMKVLARHVCEFAREADQLDSDAQRGLLAHLCGLLGLAIEAERTPRPTRRCNYRSYQRQRILTYIEAHLDDCRLTAKRAASDLGISPRWLHALLEDTGIGFCNLVARRRVEKCRALFEDPASDHLSIAEIAFLSGFNDLSTFYRRFGERYRMTPRQARRMRPQAA